jgi:hypothetical protein
MSVRNTGETYEACQIGFTTRRHNHDWKAHPSVAGQFAGRAAGSRTVGNERRMTDHNETWAIFRRRNRDAILWLILGLPAFSALSIATAVVFGTKATGPIILFFFMSIWSAIFLILGFRVTRLKCPRCGGVFFSHEEVVHASTRCCAKCGLKLYSDEIDHRPNEPPQE